MENAGHTISNARWEAGNVRDVLTYYAAAPERLFGRQIPVAGGLDLTICRTARRGRRDRAVELPDADRRLGLRPGARGRQHRGAQARRDHAADRATAGRDRAGGRAAGRRAAGRAGLRAGGRGAAGRAPGRPQDRVHRLLEGGPRDHGAVRGAGQAGDAGARRQEPEHRLRRRGRREGRGLRALRRLRQRRPGLLRAVPDLRRGLGVRGVHGALPERLPGRGDRRPAGRQDRDGPADLRGAEGARRRVRRRRRRRRTSPSAARSPTATASGSRRPSSPAPPPTRRSSARRCSARS